MNEFDDIDRELDTAFSERPSVLSRPSLRDVKRRARRHQRQRSAGVLGACAIVGVGGAAVLATRSPANQTTLGEGEAAASTICLSTATTIGYYEYDSSSAPATTLGDIDGDGVGDRFYEVLVGDNPAGVAALLGVTLEALNELNVNTPDYETFYVGLVIRIPVSSVGTTTTSPGIEIARDYTLVEGDFPAKVAEMFHVTVDQLDAANVDVNGYGGFIVGTVIQIPFASQVFATTTTGVTPTNIPDSTVLLGPTTSSTTTISGYPLEDGVLTVYITQQGDTREAVAQAFDVTVAELDAANAGTAGYPEWLVGTAVKIPFQTAHATTTTSASAVEEIYCVPENSTTTVPENTTQTTNVVTASTVGVLTSGRFVQVFNCSNQEGVARYLTDALTAVGFGMGDVDTGTIDLPITKVIYNPDDPHALAVAQSVAALLGNAAVEASGPVVPGLTLGTWAPGVSVIVLLGDDLAGKSLAQIAEQNNYTGSTAAPTSTGP